MSAAKFDPVAHAGSMRANGYWLDKSFDEFLAKAIEATPNKTAIVADRADHAEPTRISYAEFGDRIGRAAAALSKLGIGRGDVVSVQMPNWWEFAVLALAVFRIGAVLNALAPIFREHELGYMLNFAGTRLFLVPKPFRNFDYEAMATALKPSLPKLEHIVVAGGEGANSFETMLLSTDEHVPPETSGAHTGEMAVMMFTSGTTGTPKGVMQSVNALMACNIGIAGRMDIGPADTMLVCSTLGHMNGLAAGLLLGVKVGATMVLQDVWDAKRGASLMAQEGVTFSVGTATFLSDISEAVATGAPKPTHLRKYLCAGAPIPPVLMERAWRDLELQVCSCWGMTESLSSTLTEPSRALKKSPTTDGRPLDGVSVKVTRSDGTGAAVGEVGSLRVRGPMMCLGYYKRPDLELFDAGGWFDTGDLAYMDDEGYIRISGRTKDVIIRGGENVPVIEIENLLFKHPGILSVALVGYPDRRLGERACAFVVSRAGHALDLASIQSYLAEQKVAKQYWPERLEVVVDLPKTPAGKVQKYQLRERAKTFSEPVT
jgi:cyclohexanecarboxylate-CoA ligase